MHKTAGYGLTVEDDVKTNPGKHWLLPDLFPDPPGRDIDAALPFLFLVAHPHQSGRGQPSGWTLAVGD